MAARAATTLGFLGGGGEVSGGLELWWGASSGREEGAPWGRNHLSLSLTDPLGQTPHLGHPLAALIFEQKRINIVMKRKQ